MVPIYAIESFLSLKFKDDAIYFDMVRDTYEAFALYFFFKLCVSYLQGDDEDLSHVVALLDTKPDSFHPFPFSLVFGTKAVPRSRVFLVKVKNAGKLFMFVKPITTLLAVVLETQGLLRSGEFDLRYGYVYLSFLQVG